MLNCGSNYNQDVVTDIYELLFMKLEWLEPCLWECVLHFLCEKKTCKETCHLIPILGSLFSFSILHEVDDNIRAGKKEDVVFNYSRNS